MRPNTAGSGLSGLLKLLHEQQLLSWPQIGRVQAYAQAHAQTVAEAVVGCELMSASALAEHVARLFDEPLVDLSELRLQDLPHALVPLAMAKRHVLVPVRLHAGVLQLAVADPGVAPVWARLAFQHQVRIQLVVASVTQLRALLDEWQGQDTGALQAWAKDEGPWSGLPQVGSGWAGADGPVAAFVQQVLTRATQLDASDVHFECYETVHRVRIRVDGHLQVLATLPAAAWPALVSRLKVMSQLDITLKRLPQDGRLSWTAADGRQLAFRVSTVPTLYGEKVALRLLALSPELLTLSELGLLPEQYGQLQQALAVPHGLILVAGPTGSGKTVTLYACLHQLNQPEVNIVTIEDPVEMPLLGVNQVNVQDRQGLGFAAVLRAFLRQDPDVMMVGEIRDLATADIAIKAAQTGHKVLSTVHTHDVCASLTRLLNMGVSAFNVASAVHLLVAQRLVPRLCSCKQVWHTPVAIRQQLGFGPAEAAADWVEYGPKGCSLCQGRGYRGRIGVFELMQLNPELRQAVLAGESAAALSQRLAQAGVVRLRQAGLRKVMAGETSLAALLTVLGHEGG